MSSSTYPVSLDDVRAADKRIRPFIDRTPLRSYPAHESWKAGAPSPPIPPRTIADGIATAQTHDMTFRSLCDGLSGFVTVSEAEIIDAMRLILSGTHNLVEPAGAVGLAGVFKLREELEGQTVCVILTGSNLDADTLRKVVSA